MRLRLAALGQGCRSHRSRESEHPAESDIMDLMRIAIIGAGYVGLTTGAALAYLGHHVTCVENDSGKLDALERGLCPILEPGVEEVMRDAGERLGFIYDVRSIQEPEIVSG